MKKIIVPLIAILCFSTVSFAEIEKSNDKLLKTAAISAAAIAIIGAGSLAAYFGYQNKELTEGNAKKTTEIKALKEAKNTLASYSAAQKAELNKSISAFNSLADQSNELQAVIAEMKKVHPNNTKTAEAIVKAKLNNGPAAES